jgi:CRP-like cAMP-binding protein
VLTAEDLESIPLLAPLSSQLRAALACRFEVDQYGPGQPIVEQGESGHTFFVLAEGRAAVTQDDRQLGYLEAGDHFGEMAILGGDGWRNATVTAVTPVVVWALFGTSFRALQESEPEVAARLRSAMQERDADT